MENPNQNTVASSKTALQERIAQLEAELKDAREAKRTVIHFKVSEKGAVSVYGLNARFPVTLYGSQWDRLIEQMPQLKNFLIANRDKIAVKKAE